MSIRGITHTFDVCYEMVLRWMEKKAERLSAFVDTLLLAQNSDVLGPDELWSLIGAKARQLWLWVVLCHCTRQIMGWSLGEHSQQSERDLASVSSQRLPGSRYPQRLLRCHRPVPDENASLLRQSRRRNLPR